ncbi:MAG: carbon-nitrogen hydrolase family protein, partial [Acidobacteria bacterium]|nr:carbon-nitrogen hydrolase family protein [Acidobacteriota bacterium]
ALPEGHALKIGMGQTAVRWGDADANLERAAGMIAQAASASCTFVVLPECLDLGWTHPEARQFACPIPGERSNRLAQAAKENAIWVVAGLTERDGDSVYNAAVLLDDQGELRAKHRKINELDIAHDIYDTGDRLTAIQTPFGRVGVTICADNFPDSLMFAESLLLSPCAWAVDGDHDNTKQPYGDLWLTAYRALSEKYPITIAGVSSVGWMEGGPWKGRKCIGNSIAMGPGGKLLAMAPYGEAADCLTVIDVA